ncbi:MAG: LPS assembly lipoprotein LptE [Bryobacteraceae bacterium]|nr:LPS assembly lipoprotein LptE [Bryobacteraceae bacterium]MDW8379818.1 LPS assembly lipoprotein LptE [Bryobacterales bacterium]
MTRRVFLTLTAPALLAGCGYHVAGRADLLPKNIRTIAVVAFANNSPRYRLADRLPQSITREFISRTRYQIVSDPNRADAVLEGGVVNILTVPITFSTNTTGVQIHVFLRVTLRERATGKVLYENANLEHRERYEIATDPVAYFEESDAALDRLSRQVGASVVSAVLEVF